MNFRKRPTFYLHIFQCVPPTLMMGARCHYGGLHIYYQRWRKKNMYDLLPQFHFIQKKVMWIFRSDKKVQIFNIICILIYYFLFI